MKRNRLLTSALAAILVILTLSVWLTSCNKCKNGHTEVIDSAVAPTARFFKQVGALFFTRFFAYMKNKVG